MRVLVTGGAGFIGSNLSLQLLRLGLNVTAIDNLITSTGENLEPLLKHPRFTFIKHDITKAFQKKTFNFIYHLACPTGVPNIAKLWEEMLLTSSIGTKNILDLAVGIKARVLFTSSSEVYGDPKVFPQDESYTGYVDPIGYRSPYEEGKRFAEALVMAYVRKHNLDARIVRVFNTYGPSMSESDTRVTGTFLKQALSGKPLTVAGKGKQTRTFCYADDLVEGLLLAMKKGKRGEVYNLGSDQEIAIKDLAKLIIKIAKSKSKITFVDRPTHDHNRRLPSLRKVRALGWRSKTSLDAGLMRTLAWYKTLHKL